MLRERTHGRLHVYTKQVRYGEHLRNIRYLERGLGMGVEHDRSISETGILCCDRSALRDVTRHEGWGNWHIYRVAGLCQRGLVVAIHKVGNDKVSTARR